MHGLSSSLSVVALLIVTSKTSLSMTTERLSKPLGNKCNRTITKIDRTVNEINRLTSICKFAEFMSVPSGYSINTNSAE